jgi:polar amino acid transport system substrate-binding protein
MPLMRFLTKHLGLLSLLAAVWLTGCATHEPSVLTTPAPGVAVDARIVQALAPTGVLRIGVYLGSPTSMVKDAQGQSRGIALDLGQALGKALGVPTQVVVHERIAQVVQAMTQQQVDVTFTNASAARAKLIDFSAPLLDLELGYAVMTAGPITSMAEVDRSGVLVGVSEGSSSQASLTRQFQAARVVALPSLSQAATHLRTGQIQAFATNKAVLFELIDGVPGAQVLPGRWGLEHLALAIPQGRDVARPFLDQFARHVAANGTLKLAVERAGLRGAVPAL